MISDHDNFLGLKIKWYERGCLNCLACLIDDQVLHEALLDLEALNACHRQSSEDHFRLEYETILLILLVATWHWLVRVVNHTIKLSSVLLCLVKKSRFLFTHWLSAKLFCFLDIFSNHCLFNKLQMSIVFRV